MKGLIISIVLASWIPVSKAQSTYCKNSNHIMRQSAQRHDPTNKWESASFSIHIQEPRVGTPFRYSLVMLDRASDQFSIARNYDDHLVQFQVDSLGQAILQFDREASMPSDFKTKYNLDAKMGFRLKRFYQVMYGLPMSLLGEPMILNREAHVRSFENADSYMVEVELERPLISKYWRLYFSTLDYSLIGAEFYTKEKPEEGERLTFENPVNIDGLFLSRFRHWFTLHKEYLGSDIIVKEITD